MGAMDAGCKYELVNKRVFALKTMFIVAATYLFIPLMLLHDENKITSTVYALTLVALHLLFLIIYFYKVKFMQLDQNKTALFVRLLGLLFCVMLLGLTASSLSDDLGSLAIELVGLCAVHTLILAFLMMKQVPPPQGDSLEPLVVTAVV